MTDTQPKCHKCGGIRIAGHALCAECWTDWRREVMKPDPKNDAAKDEKETGRMEFDQ